MTYIIKGVNIVLLVAAVLVVLILVSGSIWSWQTSRHEHSVDDKMGRNGRREVIVAMGLSKGNKRSKQRVERMFNSYLPTTGPQNLQTQADGEQYTATVEMGLLRHDGCMTDSGDVV